MKLENLKMIESMTTYELMDYLKKAIFELKYARLTIDEYNELRDCVDLGLERLSNTSKLLVLPYKLALL